MRSPPWVEDELLIVLDIYLRERRVLEEYDPSVVAASELLNGLGLHDQAGDAGFRTPDAVVLRLANFRSLDPMSSAKGMTNSGRLARSVWEKYADSPDVVALLVDAIRDISAATAGCVLPIEEDEIGVAEGRLVYREHRRRERDPRLRARKLRQLLGAGLPLACEVCGLEPARAYGSGMERILECHHLDPLQRGERTTRLDDVALVCANCHRALHTSGLLSSLEEIRGALVSRADVGARTRV